MHQVALAVKPAISASLECLRCFVWTDDVGGSTQVGGGGVPDNEPN